jgi:hypothetical protein
MLKRISLLIGIALLALSVTAFAQTSRGTVTGVVSDSSGAVLANAEVLLTSSSTGVTQTTTTNSAGIYRFEAVLAGDYTVEVKAKGFKSLKAPATVNAGLTTGRDFQMVVGGSGESVTVEAAAVQLQTEESTRGGAIQPVALANLPIAGQNSLNLMLTLPGVVRSNQAGGGSLDSGIGAVNGARARSNNFMIDGSANNDISVAGPAFTITNNDALQEVAIQTANFTAEFGRSGGAVINQVTKSGTNNLHGTAAWVYRSEVLNASTNPQRLAYARNPTSDLKPKFKENIPAFTVGGPVYIPHIYDGHNKTFWFAGFQWDRYSAGGTTTTYSALPTDVGFQKLQALAGSCPNVQMYLNFLGSARGKTLPSTDPAYRAPISIALPTPGTNVPDFTSTSCTGTLRTGQAIEFGPYDRFTNSVYLDNNHLVRIDHIASQKQNMSFRWLWDSSTSTDGNIGFSPAYDIPFTGKTMTANFNDAYVINDRLLNEFRFSYTRNKYAWFFADGNSLGATTPYISVANISSLQIDSTYPQGRIGNSYQYQDTVAWSKGKHSVRFGGEILRQLSVQVAPFNSRGSYTFSDTTNANYNIQALANFIDDYSGQPGTNAASKLFGSGKYYPNTFVWVLFFQDSWKARQDLTINFGVRYENFGQPANIFKYPAFVGYGDADITSTARVDPDNNNFGPNFGFAWSPNWGSGIGKRISGEGKFVLRGGYQVVYDTWFNNLLSNMTAGTPNAMTSANLVSSFARGVANLSSAFNTLVPLAVNPYTSQTSMFSKHIRNPYYHRFSLGIQRELPSNIVMDLSYVGSLGRQLFYTNPLNPGVPNAAGTAVATQSTPYGTQTLRLYPNRGLIQIRDSGVTSNYNAMQLQVRRRMGTTVVGDMLFSSAYTWSRNMDILTETFGTYSSPQNPSRSPAWGIPLKDLDYGPADNDRRHVWSTALLWNLRGPKQGFWGQLAGGWSVSPIITLQSGTPYTVLNGTDSDMDGSSLGDRARIGNPNAPLNSYARFVGATTCASRLQNPATGACVTTNDVRWYQWNLYSPNDPNISRRNQTYGVGYFNIDANILKTFSITEGLKLEYRAEIFNILNHQNFDTPPSARSVSSTSYTSFLSTATANGGSRTMRMGLKVIF